MTVCVAAIGWSLDPNQALVLGAADRMLTARDVQFEPEARKVWHVTSSIALLVAGDIGLQAEVIQDLWTRVQKRSSGGVPDEALRVEDAARLYSECYMSAMLRRAEQEILRPLGLDYNSLVSRQKELSPEFLADLAKDLLNYRSYSMPQIAAILAGLDTYPVGITPHIWVVENGTELSCQDAVGFAAIGAGQSHANSLFMFAGHTPFNDFASTAFLVIAAKKRAEVAPGVGRGTDMFSVGVGLGSFREVPSELKEGLEKIYDDTRKAEQESVQKAREASQGFIQKLVTDFQAREADRQQGASPEAGPFAKDGPSAKEEPTEGEGST